MQNHASVRACYRLVHVFPENPAGLVLAAAPALRVSSAPARLTPSPLPTLYRDLTMYGPSSSYPSLR